MAGTVLHYRANNAVCRAGDLIVLDAAARIGEYNADITRTYPVSGTFTKRQREIYGIVLEAQEAAIAACKPGATNAQIDMAARDVIDRAGYGDYYIHGIGHQQRLVRRRARHPHHLPPPLRSRSAITHRSKGCRWSSRHMASSRPSTSRAAS